MNRVLVAGIAGLAMLLTASVATQESHAGFGRKCGGSDSGGGLFSNLGSRCGGREPRASCGGGGLFARLHARKAARCGGEPVDACPAPAPSCCEPAPSCCEPAPTCCETPAPACGGCETTVPACGGCSGQVVSTGCGGCGGCGGTTMMNGGVMTSGCVNCSQTMDSGVIIESSSPSVAPPAPAPIADPAADAVPSASDAPEA